MTSRAPRTGGSTRRTVLIGLAGAAVLATPGVARASVVKPDANTESLPLAVELLTITPTAYADDDPARSVVRVRARIHNTSDAPVTAVRARLLGQRSPAAARETLDRWAQASPTASTTRATAVSDDVVVGDGNLAAGARAEVVLVLAASELGSGPGAHPAAVEVVAGDDEDAERVGMLRTFLVSMPQGGDATRLTMLLPFVTGRVGDSVDLAQAVDERLGGLLAASADQRTAWALDPSLLATATAAAAVTTQPTSPAPAPSSAHSSGPSSGQGSPTPAHDGPGAPSRQQVEAVATWVAELRMASAGRAVVVLPYGDPDLAALTRAPRGTELLAEADRVTGSTLDSAGLVGAVLLPDVAWPADEAADNGVLALATGTGSTSVVVDDVSLRTDADLTYTPSGRATLSAGTGDVAALVADATLSGLLARLGDTDQAVLVRQRILAELATITLQRPNDPRSLLLVAPRSFAPDADAVNDLVGAVEDSGWGRWQPLTDLLAVAVRDEERTGPTIPSAVRSAELPIRDVTTVSTALAEVDAFATALTGTDATLLAQRRAALVLLGVSWRGHEDELPTAHARVAAGIDTLAKGIRIAGGSVRNLAAERSELPITLVNELDVAVQVDLVLRPRTPRVQLDTVPRQSVAAHSQHRVAVPVRALANGSVIVEAELRTPAGTRIGDAVEVDLNVRADVENWITGVVGGGAVAVLGVGLVRAVRRGHRRVDEVEHADVGTDQTTNQGEDRTSATTGQG